MIRTHASHPIRRAPRLVPAVLLAAAALLAHGRAAAASWHVPRPVERTLSNGLRVVVFPDPRSGLVHLSLRAPAGTSAEPEGRSGLAALTAQLLVRGTATRDASTFAAEQMRLGGTLQPQAAREWATLGGTFLASSWIEGLGLLADAASSPVFLDAEVRRAVLQTTRALEVGRSAAALADDELWRVALAGHPGAGPALGTPADVSRIGRETVLRFHRERWRPGGSALVIVGAVEPGEAFAAAERAFRLWSGAAPPDAPPPDSARAPRVVIVDRPGERVEIRLGAAVPGRAAADDPARALAARLFEERLARSAAAWGETGGDARTWLSTLRDEGLWAIAASAPPESAGAVARRLRAAWRSFLAAPPDAAEARRAATAAAGAFPFLFETAAGRAAQWISADATGGAEALDRWPGTVRALTPADVHAAARRRLDPDRATLVAVGPANRLRRALAGFGTVEVTSAPDAAREAFDATPEERAEGRRVVARALAAHGGEAALRGIVDSITESAVLLTIQGSIIEGRLVQMRKDPDKLVFITTYQDVEQRQVLNGRRAWTQTSRGEVRAADSAGVATLRNGLLSDLPHLLRAIADSAAAVAARGAERFGDRTAVRLDVRLPDGERRAFLFDAETARLLAQEADEMVAGGRVPARRLYRDYRTVQGVVWPHQEERQIAGERLMQITTESVRLNTGVRDDAFAEPVAAPVRGR
jgi:zinc protease